MQFSVWSRDAHAVDLCLFDAADPSVETARRRLTRDEQGFWSGFVEGAGSGTPYGFRAHGPWAPQHGLYFNPRKLLLDPHAKAVSGGHDWNRGMQGITPSGKPDYLDSGRTAMKSVVVRDEFDWEGDRAPRIPWADTMIYELHVRGFTRLHPLIPQDLRGTFAGLAHPAALQYLKDLGITAVQLLPIHLHLDDGFLLDRGLTNYWGYNSLGFFAPHPEYAAAREPQAQVDEFKSMVRDLHRAGLEVILDVVYNHTAEGDESGPLVSFRGLDNPGFYMMNQDARTL
ncbi:MAG TPA: alpha-amylase family glycosyl hydrolase, partial [Verrucomicrobiaceae bacterium]